MQPVEILTAARALIQDPAHWTQGSFARDEHGHDVDALAPTAQCFCAYGAIVKVTNKDTLRHNPAGPFLRSAAAALCGVPHPADLNDGVNHAPGLTPHQAVLKMFDLAIEEAKSHDS
jgi:hypothetical protein